MCNCNTQKVSLGTLIELNYVNEFKI